MSTFDLTRHAVLRMSHRGIGLDDIELVEWIGTEVESGYLLRQKDFQAYEREMKKRIDRAQRLVGKRVVRDGDVLITVYHAGRRKERRLLRHAAR